MDATLMKLLTDADPAVFTVEHERGKSPFFITVDHGGRRLPERLGNLGLTEEELRRHIAWDIGASAVARRLGDGLDAFTIHQTYSRLVIDCNRDPAVDTSIVTVSESTEIPGNRNLSAAERAARANEILWPYHGRIVRALDEREAAGRPSVLIAMHSFTPAFKGVSRPWHVGVLYNRHPRFAHIMKALFEAEGDLVVGDNEPYAVSDASDYTIPVHGERRGLPHVEFEIRQDLIAEEAGQHAWADRLIRLMPEAYRRLSAACGPEPEANPRTHP
jgi:predicted N-formylglutamate amidohydrolase